MASDPKQWREVAEGPEIPEEVGRPAGERLRLSVVRAWRVLEFSSAYLAVVAAVEVLVVTYLLSLPLSPAPVIGALVTFAIYANDRLVDLESDGLSNPRRAAFVDQYRDELYVLAALAYGLAVTLAASGGPVAFGLTLLPGAVWVVYAVDWIRLPAVDIERLKQLPVVSSALVALAWALPVVALPVIFAGTGLTVGAGVLFAYFFVGVFVNSEVSNAHDIESDTENGVTTIPTAIGLERTRAVLASLTLLAAAIPVVAALSGSLTALSAGLLVLGVVLTGTVTGLLGRTDRGRLLTVTTECARVPVLLVIGLIVIVS